MIFLLAPAKELQQCIEAAWLEGHPKVRSFGVCVCVSIDMGAETIIGGKPPKWMVYDGKPY